MSEKEYTLIIIKPDAVSDGYTGSILKRITEEKFEIKALKMLRLTKQKAEKFYEVHKERPFYDELAEFMSSGPVLVACLGKRKCNFSLEKGNRCYRP